MAESLIKWTRSDYAKLSRAVRDFNKKINELNKNENNLYLPALKNYQEVKSQILNRKELNKVLNSLRRFKNEGSEDIVQLESGEFITKWEKKELEIRRRAATRYLNQEIAKVTDPTPFKSRYEIILETQLESLNKLNTAKGDYFKILKDRIYKIGRGDYKLYQAEQYRKNYFKMLKHYKNFDNYKKFVGELQNIKNPIDFYNFVNQNEQLSDIQYMYDAESGVIVFGITTQDKFNSMLLSVRN